MALSPLRQQGDVSRILAVLPAVLLQDSGAPPVACTQGLGTTLPDTLAHSYTPPVVRLDSLLASIKGRSRATLRGFARGKRRTNSVCVSLSLSRDELVTPTASGTPGAG
jgi:hypothetical protein